MMFGYHVARLLSSLWTKRFGVDETEYLRLFSGMGADNEMRDLYLTWYEVLKKSLKSDRFRAGYTRIITDMPCVFVETKETPVESQPLGFTLRVLPSGARQIGAIVRSTATIHACTPAGSNEIVALHEFIRQSMMISVKYFASLGFTGLVYVGGTDESPYELMVSEQGGVTESIQTWSVYYTPSYTEADPTTVSGVLAFPSDDMIEGITGGVVVVVPK